MQRFVKAVAPKDKKTHVSVRPWIIMLTLAPMLVLMVTRFSMMYLRICTLLCANVIVRLMWPSQYYPATAVNKSLIAQPAVARLIAYLAEFGLYELWALWCGLDFWNNPVWLIVFVGENISCIGVLLQSESILYLEDCVWTFHALYMVFYSITVL